MFSVLNSQMGSNNKLNIDLMFAFNKLTLNYNYSLKAIQISNL